jgi:hypothetical protein
MKSAASPMPPGGAPPAADVATLEAWVAAGAPAGSCGGGGGDGGGGGGGSPPVAEGDLPCDVEAFLTARCTSCHSDPPRNGAPMALTTYGALVATNAAGERVADRALAELKKGDMPPGGDALSAAQYKVFEDWVAAGAAPGAGTCTPVDDPFDDPVTCSSGRTAGFCDDDRVGAGLRDGDDCAGPTMNPGLACGSSNCHGSGGEGPRLWFGGTVYRTGHEPNLCRGGPADGDEARVVVTDKNGKVVSRLVNSAGNFVLEREDLGSLAFPIRAKVTYQGRERAMNTPQNSGDCNGCHTRDGTNGAPGRIVLP